MHMSGEQHQIESSVTEQSIIAIGESAYASQGGEAKNKPLRLLANNRTGSAGTSQREPFKTSQVLMGPQEFKSLSRMG